jgi:hypothetical protein
MIEGAGVAIDRRPVKAHREVDGFRARRYCWGYAGYGGSWNSRIPKVGRKVQSS